MQPVLRFLARVEHRAVDPLRGHADEAPALAVGDPEPFRLVRAALANSRGCVACFSAGAFSLDSISVAVRRRSAKETFMDEGIKTYRLTWHGPVGNVEFDVDAFDEDDAKHTLAAWLNGDDDLGDLIRKV